MKINFAHVCDYALVSKEGKLSVLGIFNQLRPKELPWHHPTMFIAFEIGLEPAELGTTIKMKMEIRDEDGGSVLSMDGDITTKGTAKIGETPAARQVVTLNGVPFNRAGPYDVNFWLQGNLAYTLRLEVRAPAPPQTA